MSNNSTPYWTAFYTKPRNEKKASERLLKSGFEMYCPTRTVLKQWSDRKKKVQEPVFTSYVFAKVDEAQRLEILLDHAIVNSVFWLGKPVVIRDLEMEEIRQFLDEHPNAQTQQRNFREGDDVFVNSGPLSGQSGAIAQIRGNRAYLFIPNLGMALSAEVGLVHLQKVG